MTERAVCDEFWGDPFVEELPKDGKLLYLWLMTNKRLNPSGIFEVSVRAITNETGIEAQDVPGLFQLLNEKVVWQPTKNLVWVKNFTRRQCKNFKFLLGAMPYLKALKDCELKDQFIQYNLSIFNEYSIDIVSILYGNGMHTPDTDTDTDTDTISNTVTDKPSSFSLPFSSYKERRKREKGRESNPKEYEEKYGHLLKKS